MNTILKKASTAIITLVVMVSSVVFGMQGKMTAKGASDVGGCDGDHSAGTMWTGDEPLENDGSYYLDNSVKLSEEIEIKGNVTLCLHGHTITAASGSRIFKVKKDGSLTICNCKEDGIITGGDNSSGGAVYVEKDGTFTLSGGTIWDNSANQGGGVYNAGIFKMNGGIILENSSEEGGGVYVNSDSAEFEMTGGTILENTASHEGGGVYVGGSGSVSGIFTMSGGAISGNTVYKADASDNGGGGVYTAGKFTMSGDSEISDNTAGTIDTGEYCMGGGVCVSGTNAEFIMDGGTLSGNKAIYGGGVYVSTHGKFEMTGGTIGDANYAVNGGGGVGMGGGEFLMSGGMISENTTERRGGGVYNNTGKFTISNGTISNNESRDGGGVYLDNGEFTMNDGAISDNTSREGGGVYLRGGEFTMNDGAISDNTAKKVGSCVYVGNENGGGTMTLNGKVEISSQEESNVYLKSGKTITIGKSFSTDHEIGVHPEDTPTCIDFVPATTFDTNVTATDISTMFKADVVGQSILYNDKLSRVELKGEHNYNNTKWENDPDDHWHECTVCHDKKDIEKHNWDGGTVTKNPTCTVAGEKTYTCKDCQRTKPEPIPAGHQYDDTQWKNDPDNHWHECTVCGDKKDTDKHEYDDTKWENDPDYHWHECTVCGAKKNPEKHNWDGGTVTKNPTCTVAGEKTYTCKDCKLTKPEPIPAGHKFDDTKWEDDPDYHWHECTVCHDKKDTDKHNWDGGEVTKEPTCTVAGEKMYTCKDCQRTKTEPIPAEHKYDDQWENDPDYHWHECTVCHDKKDTDKHNWVGGEVTKEPTCTVAGEKTYTCKDCQRTKTEPIPAEHKYDDQWENDPDYHWHECTVCHDKKDTDKHNWDGGEVTKEPTCTVAGEKTYTCEDCKLTKTETIPAGHKYDDTQWKNDPNYHWHECTVCGDKKDTEEHKYDDTKWENDPDYHWHKCTVCGAKKDTDNHNWDSGEVTKEPTCTVTGEKTYTCEDCKLTKTEPIPAGHKYDDTKWENDPDDHWHECTVCGDKKDIEKHNWDDGKVTKEPTCTEAGEKTYTCEDCKFTKTEPIPAGHKYDGTQWENDPDYHWHECTVCGDKKDTENHNWDDGTVTKEPTYTESGEITYICIDCKREKTETIPPKNPENSKDTEDSKEPEDSNDPEDSKEPEDSKTPDDSGDPNYPGDSSVTDDSNSSTESSTDPDNNGDHENVIPNNPPTGIAISLVPLASAITALTVTLMRKKK